MNPITDRIQKEIEELIDVIFGMYCSRDHKQTISGDGITVTIENQPNKATFKALKEANVFTTMKIIEKYTQPKQIYEVDLSGSTEAEKAIGRIIELVAPQ